MRTRGKTALGITGTALATLMAAAVAQPAAAGDFQQDARPGTHNSDHRWVCLLNTPAKSAVGCFQPYGEVFWLKDMKKDGRAIVVRWWSSSGRDGSIYSHLGKGNWGYVNKSFAESTSVTYRVCEYYSYQAVMCSDSLTVSAGME